MAQNREKRCILRLWEPGERTKSDFICASFEASCHCPSLRRWGGGPHKRYRSSYVEPRNKISRVPPSHREHTYARTTLGWSEHWAMVDRAVRQQKAIECSKPFSNVGHGATQTAGNLSGDRRDFESVHTQLSFLSPTLPQSEAPPCTASGRNNRPSAKAAPAPAIGRQALSKAHRVIVSPPGDSAELAPEGG